MNDMIIFFKGAKKGFKNFSHTITDIISFFLLFIAYVLGIGPVSIISKLFKKHFLDLKKQNRKSNWHEHRLEKQPLVKYYRTF